MQKQTIKVKICGVKEKEDLVFIDRLGADYIGFVLYPKSPRYAGDKIKELLAFETKARKVAVFVNPDYEEVKKVLVEDESHIAKIKEELIQDIAEKSQEVKGIIEKEKGEIIKLKAEIEDLKKKLSIVVRENEKLKEQLDTINISYNPSPYIIE